MIERNYKKNKSYISPKALIIIGIALVSFCPITIFMYGIPVFSYLIGVILLWTDSGKFTDKILWTIVPIIIGLISFYCFMQSF